MEKDLKIIEKELERTHSDPNHLAHLRLKLASYYSFYAGHYESILKRQAKTWNAIREREDVKSDRRADRLYQATDDGINEVVIKVRLKRIQNMMNSIASSLAVMNTNARHET